MQIAPRAQLEQFARDQYRKQFGGPPMPTRLGNVTPLFELGRVLVIEYRGTPLLVPPVPARIVPRLMEIRTLIEAKRAAAQKGRAPTVAEVRAYSQLLEQTVAIITRCLRPCSVRGRLLRMCRLWRPLHDASEGEIGELLNFLWLRRATSSIRYFSAETSGPPGLDHSTS